MDIRAQLAMFPEEQPESGQTQEQGLAATFKLFQRIQSITHESPRQVWNSMIGALTNATRGGREFPDMTKIKPLLPLGDEIPDESTLEYYLPMYERDRQMFNDYLMFISDCPPCDYLGQVAGEEGVLNRKDQFFTPSNVCEMMIKMTMGNLEKNEHGLITVCDPACGTGRFSLYTLLHYDMVIFFSIDIDIDMVRASMLTHSIFFDLNEAWVRRRGKFWFFLCADTLARGELTSPYHPNWLHSNSWDQPQSLKEWPVKEATK